MFLRCILCEINVGLTIAEGKETGTNCAQHNVIALLQAVNNDLMRNGWWQWKVWLMGTGSLSNANQMAERVYISLFGCLCINLLRNTFGLVMDAAGTNSNMAKGPPQIQTQTQTHVHKDYTPT